MEDRRRMCTALGYSTPMHYLPSFGAPFMVVVPDVGLGLQIGRSATFEMQSYADGSIMGLGRLYPKSFTLRSSQPLDFLGLRPNRISSHSPPIWAYTPCWETKSWALYLQGLNTVQYLINRFLYPTILLIISIS